MKKILLLLALCTSLTAWAQDEYFYAECPTGQILQYLINADGNTVTLVDADNPVGAVEIPGIVSNGSNTYTVTRIDYAFYGDSNMTSVIIPSTVTEIGDHSFAFCSGLTSIDIPDSVTFIDSFAFRECTGLETLTLGQSVEGIAQTAFYNCTGLTTINFNATNCTSIGNDDFAYSNIETLNIGNNVTRIPQNAFQYCTNLTNLNFGNALAIIEAEAFRGCSAIPGDLVLPESLGHIGMQAFSECNGITSLTIPPALTICDMGAFSNCLGLTTVNFNATHCQRMELAFSNTPAFTTLNISDNVTTIPYRAFAESFGLTTINFGNSVNYIDGDAFYRCISLTSVNIPNSVNFLGASAFGDCYALSSVVLSNTLSYIGDYAFSQTAISAITIPESVSSIGIYAFYNCNRLSTLNFNAAHCYQMGEHVFYNNAPLTITIGDQVTLIPDIAFYDCSTLIHVDFENAHALTSIGQHAFEACQGLTSISLPEPLTTLGDDAFNGCTGLLSVSLPNSLQIIGNGAFENCNNLLYTAIPNSVTNIGDSAFEYCEDLESITIGHSVTQIGEDAFRYCSLLSEIKMRSETPPTIQAHTFSNSGLSKIYVPCGSLEDYQNANLWSAFDEFIQEIVPFELIVESADATMGTAIIVQEPDCDTHEAIIEAIANNGYHFVEWNDGNTDNPRTVTVTENATYIATFAHTTGLDENDDSTTTLYPNPTMGLIVIEGEGIHEIRVFNSTGQQIMLVNAKGATSLQIDLNSLPTGIYTLQAVGENRLYTKRIVKK